MEKVAGKFEASKDPIVGEYLYECSLAEFLDDEFGSSSYGNGWRGLLIIDREQTPEFGGLTTPKLADAYILFEDTNGFFTYEEFKNAMEAKQAWADLKKYAQDK